MTKEEEKALCALVRFGMRVTSCIERSGEGFVVLSKQKLQNALDFYEACGMDTYSGVKTDDMRAACDLFNEDGIYCDLYVKAEPISNDRKND